MMAEKITYYTIDELMAFCLASTIKEGDTVTIIGLSFGLSAK